MPDSSPDVIGFRYVWTVRVSKRPLSADDSIILHVSPKFATVHDCVSFQWTLKLHNTNGVLPGTDNEDESGVPPPSQYVACELYFNDGPVSHISVQASVRVIIRDVAETPPPASNIDDRSWRNIHRGRGFELTDTDTKDISEYIMENVGNVIRLGVLIRMNSKLFDPYTYLDSVSPTPQKSFLTTNYNARVNSKIWKRRSKKKNSDGSVKISRKEQIDYEARFRKIISQEQIQTTRLESRLKVVESKLQSRRGSAVSIADAMSECQMLPDHEHLFKKVLIACCDSCEKRRASCTETSHTEDSEQEEGDSDGSSCADEEESFECHQIDKGHVHDLLANLYFNEVVLPHLEYVEDFVDLLIDAELNDLPVLKRACERYLCGELNTKKDLVTSLLLDLLFIAIVFNLPVMKSMTLAELSNRVDDLRRSDQLMQLEEYKCLDKRIRSLSDRNLIELIEQCLSFREQRMRVQVILPNS